MVKKSYQFNVGKKTLDLYNKEMKNTKAKINRTKKKYGVDFAIARDKATDPSRYTVFFKAKDADAITNVLKEYAAKQIKKQQEKQRPSILEKLKKFKDIVAKTPKKEKERRKEQER